MHTSYSYYISCVIVIPNSKVSSIYRKTHLMYFDVNFQHFKVRVRK